MYQEKQIRRKLMGEAPKRQSTITPRQPRQNGNHKRENELQAELYKAFTESDKPDKIK